MASKAARKQFPRRSRLAKASARQRPDALGREPIKIGHHSQGRHRRAIDRTHRSLGGSVEAQREADQAAEQAKSAAVTTHLRYSVRQVANRIEKINTQIRATNRGLNGYLCSPGTPYAEQVQPASGKHRKRLERDLAEKQDELAYWAGVRSRQVADGVATDFSRGQINTGDLGLAHGQWQRVVRANVKTVSLETGYSWTSKVAYTDVKAVKSAAAVDEAWTRRRPAARR